MVRLPAVVKSIIFHGVITAAFVVGMPLLSRDIAPDQPILTVDLVNLAPETNLDEGVEGKTQPKPEPKEQPEPKQEKAPPPPPPPPPPAPAPEPEAAPSEAEQVAQAVPIPTPEPKPVKAPKPKAEKKAKPKPVKAPPKRPVKKSPEYKKRQDQQAQLTSKLKDLTERQKAARKKKDEDEKKKNEAQDKLNKLLEQKSKEKADDAKREETEEKMADLIGQALNTPRKTSAKLGISEQDMLRSHLANCWTPPPGAAGAETLIVDIIVRLNKRAEVKDVEIEDKTRMKNDATFKAAAKEAQRAVVECSPLPLPLDKYEAWKELSFAFDPSFITRN